MRPWAEYLALSRYSKKAIILSFKNFVYNQVKTMKWNIGTGLYDLLLENTGSQFQNFTWLSPKRLIRAKGKKRMKVYEVWLRVD